MDAATAFLLGVPWNPDGEEGQKPSKPYAQREGAERFLDTSRWRKSETGARFDYQRELAERAAREKQRADAEGAWAAKRYPHSPPSTGYGR